MSFNDEIVKLQRTRRAYLRFALEENNPARTWYGAVDRRYGKADDSTGIVPVYGTVVRFGQVQRSLANFLYSLEVPNVSVELLDPDGEWRAYVGGTTDHLINRNISLWLRVHDDLGDSVFEDRLSIMQVRKPSFLPGGRIQLDCQVASGGFLGDKIPRRFITTSDWSNAPVESQGLPVNIIYGELHNEVVPFTFGTGEGGSTGPGGGIPGQVVSLGRFYPLRDTAPGSAQRDLENFHGLSSAKGNWGSKNVTTNIMSRNKGDQLSNGDTFNYQFESTDPATAERHGGCMFLYELTAPISIQGTLDLCFPKQGNYPYAPDKEMHWAVHAYVTIGRTGQVRGVLLNNYWEPIGVNNLPGHNDAQTMQLASPVPINTVLGQKGDIVVVEIGIVQYNVPPTAPYGNASTIWWGTKSNDGTPLADLVRGIRPTVKSIFGYLDFGQSPPLGASWIEFDAGNASVPPTSPYTGDPASPTPMPECDSEEEGAISSDGGAVRAVRVGGYVVSPESTTEEFPPISAPVISGGVVGPGGSLTVRYVVTAIQDIPGAPIPQSYQNRTNHIGETNPSNVLTITNAPTKPGTSAVGGSYGTGNYVHIEWDLVPGATTYRVYRKRSGIDADFYLIDAWSGSGTDAFNPDGKGHYNDGEISGRSEYDIPKRDSTPPDTNQSGSGTVTSPAQINNIYVLAGHALKEVTEVYVHKPVLITTPVESATSGDSTDTPVRSDPVPVLQTEGVDYEQRWIDINGNRYHVLIFNQAQISETCEYYEITANVKGIETNGDGTGTLITDAVDVVEHFMLNWILNSYRSSQGPYAPPGGPWFTDVPYAPGLWDFAAAATAKATSANRIDGGYQFAGILDRVVEVRELIRELLFSGDLTLAFSDQGSGVSGAWSLGMLSLNVDPMTLPHYDASDIILATTFEISVEVDLQVNVIPFFSGPYTQTVNVNKVRPGGGWLISGELRDFESISLYGLAVSEPLYLRWVRDPATALDVITHYLSYLRFPPLLARHRAGLQPILEIPGSLVTISHPDGVGGPWNRHLCQIIRNDVDADRLVSDVSLMSFQFLL